MILNKINNGSFLLKASRRKAGLGMKWYVNILEETVIQVAQFYYVLLYLFSNFTLITGFF